MVSGLMAHLEMQGVSKAYGRTHVLRHIQLTIANDVTTAIVGPSGSGKSTLLKLINGLVRPDGGVVSLFGAPLDYHSLPQLRLHIGYAVQGVGLFPHMTVMENIALLARLCRWEKERIDRRVEELMELVELPLSYGQRYPHQLSGGEQQRVGLCRAMVMDPKLLLLDEPFAALDRFTKQDIHEEFLRLQRASKRTAVLVTHDISEALTLAQRIVVLHRGEIVQHGSCEEMMRAPVNDFVRELFAQHATHDAIHHRYDSRVGKETRASHPIAGFFTPWPEEDAT